MLKTDFIRINDSQLLGFKYKFIFYIKFEQHQKFSHLQLFIVIINLKY